LADWIVKAGQIYVMDDRRSTWGIERARQVMPALTVVGGRGSWDPQGRMG
jgi:hypothetical protein